MVIEENLPTPFGMFLEVNVKPANTPWQVIFQTVTSIQEQTLTFVPKIISIFITLILCGGWIMDNIVSFMTRLFENFATYVR